MMRAGLAAFALVLAAAAPAHADPLTVRGQRLYLEVAVNGHPVEALLDSAAELSLADREAAAALGLTSGEAVTARGSGGSQSARIVPGNTIAALGLRLDNAPVAVTDLGDVGQRLLGRRLAFILGHDFFAAARLAIDIEGGTIALAPSSQRPAGVELKLTDHDGISAAPVTVAGRTVLADLDLGNGTGLLISRQLARELRLVPVGIEPGGGLGGAHPREVVYLPELVIAGRRFTHLRAHVDPLENAGALNIGVELLRRFRIVSDFGAGRIWLEPRH